LLSDEDGTSISKSPTVRQPASPRGSLTAAVVITTKNRKDELLRAVESAAAQEGAPEVLVVDDGSTDGSTDVVRERFPPERYPHVRVVRHDHSAGYITRRNEAAMLTSADVVISIDDDATFSSPRVVAQTLRQFDDPRIGAIAMPYVDVTYGPQVHQRAPSPEGSWCAFVYRGTAHALRRELFLRLGAYRPFLVHQNEEPDYCYRLYDAGYVVRLGSADPVLHFESPKRDKSRVMYHWLRNAILISWYNVPMPYLLIHLPGIAAIQTVRATRQGYLGSALRGCFWGVVHLFRQLGERRPVRRATYRLLRRIKKSPAIPLTDVIAGGLPPARSISATPPE
jgi:glycosyltransferase involved in cell wall biosynthesis